MINEPLVHKPTDLAAATPSLADLLARPPQTQAASANAPWSETEFLGDAPSVLHPPTARNGNVPNIRLASSSDAPAISAASPASPASVTPIPFPTADQRVAPQSSANNTARNAVPAGAPRSNTARVPLLLVQPGVPLGGGVQGWLSEVLEGALPFFVRSHQTVSEQVQYLQPQGVLIYFDAGSLNAAVEQATELQTLFPHIPRVAIGHSQDAQSMLAALRVGVQDFLDLDGPIETAQFSITQLLQRPLANASQQPIAPRTAIVSARAGLGCSLLAAHLSWHLQQRLSTPVPTETKPVVNAKAPAAHLQEQALDSLLIELGSPGGDCAIYLNTPGEFNFMDAVSQQHRLDQRMAQRALSRHESGLRLLSMPHQQFTPSSSDVDGLLARLGQYFRHIVMDLGAGTSPQLLRDVLPSANQIWVLCDQSVASVVWTTELLKQLDAQHISREHMQLIVSRHDPRLELSGEQIARQLQLPLLTCIAERRRELSHAVNQGLLLNSGQTREPYVQSIDRLVGLLLAEHHPSVAAAPVRAESPLRKLLQRLSRS